MTKLTPAQREALLWLPADGSWRANYPEGGAPMWSTIGVLLSRDLVAAKLNYGVDWWSLTPAGIAARAGIEKGALRMRTAEARAAYVLAYKVFLAACEALHRSEDSCDWSADSREELAHRAAEKIEAEVKYTLARDRYVDALRRDAEAEKEPAEWSEP